MADNTWIYIIRMLVACCCGFLIGIERRNRSKKAGVRTHVIVACGAALTLICVLFAGELVAFFGIDDPAALGTAASAFRLFSVSTVFTGVNMVVTSFWQSIGRARMAGAMSILRNFLLHLP